MRQCKNGACEYCHHNCAIIQVSAGLNRIVPMVENLRNVSGEGNCQNQRCAVLDDVLSHLGKRSSNSAMDTSIGKEMQIGGAVSRVSVGGGVAPTNTLNG